MAKKKKNSKVIPYRRPRNINVGMIMFAIIFVYMAFSVYTYINRDKVQFYEVSEGNIVGNAEYTGVILREESVQYTDRAGYINYYVREGKRAAVGSRIYSIDETGSLASFLEEHPEANATLTDSNVSDIKRELTAYSISYQPEQFGNVYGLQSSLESAVMEYANFNALDSLDSLIEQSGISFQQVRAPQSGVVSYAVDGYEGLTADQITAQSFDRSEYSKSSTKAGNLIENGAPAYKLVTSDTWSLIFPLSQEEVASYQGQTTLHVRFSAGDLETDGAFSIYTGSDGASYGRLDFQKYMVEFVSDRFLHFEVESPQTEGLKIPVTAVTEKSFFLVPVDYLDQGGDSSDGGFLKEVYDPDTASTSVVFTPATIYYSTDEYYYIDQSEDGALKTGDYLVKPQSTERYQLGPSATLQGVYNINKGYAVFKQIEIIGSNDEYYSIRKGTKYGLSVYDHIVLNANSVYEGELIYQ